MFRIQIRTPREESNCRGHVPPPPPTAPAFGTSKQGTWKQAPQPTPPLYSAGPAAARKPPLKDAAKAPYPHEPAAQFIQQPKDESIN
jgi:hypothetical protein